MEKEYPIVEYHELVAMLRGRAGMTKAELAEAVGMSAVHLGRIERGEASPKIDTALKILEVLGVEGIWEEIDKMDNIEKYPAMLRETARALEDALPILTRLRFLSGDAPVGEPKEPEGEIPKVAEDGSGYGEEGEE